MEFISEMICGRLNLFFMSPQDQMDEFEKKAKQQHEAAINAFQYFASNYSPGTKDDADTFYSTIEIQKAIADHTGVILDAAHIYELMQQMNYSYEAMNGLEFNWLLLKKS